MYYLTPAMAQRIVDRIMEVVPYNINIMDHRGVIIASGDKPRIGTKHQGALKVLQLQDAHCVQQDTPTERRGINLPIRYEDRLVGVIGISGAVDEVMQLGRLVATTAQLILENDVINEQSAVRENQLNSFFFEWTHRNPQDYSDSFLAQAAYFNIDLDKPRAAALLIMDNTKYTLIDQIRGLMGAGDYMVRQSIDSLTLLFDAKGPYQTRLERMMALSTALQNAYVSDVGTVAAQLVPAVQRLYMVARRLQVPWRIVYSQQLLLESKLSDLPVDAVTRSVMDQLSSAESCDGLRLTILNYVEYSNDLKTVCEKLYIHRNTLNYRIERIRDLTGLSLKNGKEMMLLYLAALQMSIHPATQV